LTNQTNPVYYAQLKQTGVIQMNATKQTTYSWDSKTNATEQETREFANYLLGLLGEKSLKPTLKFEIAPKSTEIRANWYDANIYCSELNIDGKVGWRLPTREELYRIYKSENDFEAWNYWSSIECNDYRAWFQNMHNGCQQGLDKNSFSFYVRAVRDLS
jgi:hypothetical protein